MLIAIKWYRIVLVGIPRIALYVFEYYCIVQQSLREHSRYVSRCALVFSCPADSSIGDLVTHSLSEWVSDLFKNTTNERPQRLVSFETFDQSDEETWPDPKKDNDKDKYKDKDNDKDKYI